MDLGFIDQENGKIWVDESEELSRAIGKLIQNLRNKIN